MVSGRMQRIRPRRGKNAGGVLELKIDMADKEYDIRMDVHTLFCAPWVRSNGGGRPQTHSDNEGFLQGNF